MISELVPRESHEAALTRQEVSRGTDLPSTVSPVPCYTCRRRHVRCDGALPHCKKCARAGISCLGYQKPLRWVGGVAFRGKFKGQLQPTAKSQVQSQELIVNHNAPKETGYFGTHKSENMYCDFVPKMSTFMELIKYHNAVVCSENDALSIVKRPIAPLDPARVKASPRPVLNALMACIAVHMAARNRGNRQLYRLALELKACVFSSFNRMLQQERRPPSDLEICVVVLLFALDIIENGLDRWRTHYEGGAQMVSALGGLDAMKQKYPYLAPGVFHVVFTEACSIFCTYMGLEQPRIASREAILSYDYSTVLDVCPSPLLLPLWDTGTTAAATFGKNAGAAKRKKLQKPASILDSILSFQPITWVQEVQNEYGGTEPDGIDTQGWLLIATAWQNATIIVVLRYLFFGRARHVSNAASPAQGSHSRKPSQQSSHLPPHRSPQPNSTDQIASQYSMHNHAFIALTSSLTSILNNCSQNCLRFILIPTIVLALVSTPSSLERNLCTWIISAYREQLTISLLPRAPSPYALPSDTPHKADFDPALNIPFDELDAFTAMAELQNSESWAHVEEKLVGAVEWNWWDMLQTLKLDISWPVTAGLAYLDRGPDVSGHALMSIVVNEGAFDAWAERGVGTSV